MEIGRAGEIEAEKDYISKINPETSSVRTVELIKFFIPGGANIEEQRSADPTKTDGTEREPNPEIVYQRKAKFVGRE